ncbi:hypothetical protein L195_g019148, partial [Trifolium pratense]
MAAQMNNGRSVEELKEWTELLERDLETIMNGTYVHTMAYMSIMHLLPLERPLLLQRWWWLQRRKTNHRTGTVPVSGTGTGTRYDIFRKFKVQ